MQIEELTKSQIFLLTLLTSFVTSIATGIITVALLDQAPTTITQSVNRIVRESIEKSAPNKAVRATVAAAVALPVKSESEEHKENIVTAIERATPSVVRLYSSEKDAPTFLSFGIVIDTDGTIVADYGAFPESAAVATFADGFSTNVSVSARTTKTGLVYLRPASTTAALSHYGQATLSPDLPAIGQSVISLIGKSELRIASGLVVALNTSDTGVPKTIDTNIAGEMIARGTPIIDEYGAILGISTNVSRSVERGAFMPSPVIAAEYASMKSEMKSEVLKND